MSVDVRGLKITIGGKPIVSDADMTIADGERVGLIGSSRLRKIYDCQGDAGVAAPDRCD
mgnify:CR=1 FL=1